ncbi:hypothetical protein LTR17_021193 [Elasticomyces elasticus]|nr:hypothetical protein LTR17_021193 [Elasticomyces elasticus]
MADVNSLTQPDQGRRRIKSSIVKHRSSQACQACRGRKVRCDVLTSGPPCMNCRLDRLECVVSASRRGKGKQTAQDCATQATHSHPKPVATSLGTASSPIWTEARATQEHQGHVITPTGSTAEGGMIQVSVTFDEDVDVDGNERQSTGDSENAAHATSKADDGLLPPRVATVSPEQHGRPTEIVSLPAFIAPLSTHVLQSEDIQYLVQKGALLIPEPDLRLEILRGYMFSIQPFLPVLDAQQFISAVFNNGEQGKVSLLLFQAVMFAGLHSLQPPIIHRLGFETTKQAREVFFNRVRLLYDFDTEPNSIAVFQSLLLMSSWYSKWHERRHTWHWTGLAYDLARSMGLHREPTTRHVPDKVSRFRTRRPMRIRDDDFDVLMLTLPDFENPTLEERTDEMKSVLPDVEETTSTALMCIQLAKLSICIGHVVSSQYTTLNPQLDVPRTMLVVSKRDGSALDEIETCNKELDGWYRALNEDIQRPDLPVAGHDLPSCSEVHWSILCLTHLTTVNVLHRAQALHPLPDLAEAQKTPESLRTKVKDAAREITKLTQIMLHKDQARFLGLIGVTATIAACLSHTLDINSSNEDVRDASTLRLYQSLQVLQYLRAIYASADAAASFVASLAGQAGIPISTQAAPSAAEPTCIGTSSLRSSSTTFNRSSPYGRLATSNSTTWPLSQLPRDSWQSRSAADSHMPLLGVKGSSGNATRSRQTPGATDLDTAMLPGSSSSASGSWGRNMFGNPMASEQDIFQIDTTYGGSWNPGGGPSSVDWNGNPEAGNDLAFMAFDYNFFMDASNFVDEQNRWSQRY